MVEHRKNIGPGKAYAPSSWFIVLTVLLCIGGAGWIGWLVLDDGSSDAPTATPSAAMTSKAPTKAPTKAPEPTASPEPTKPSPDSPTDRDVPVSVLNNSSVTGAAKTFSAKVTAAGWTVGGVGNWTGSIESNTVYYPPGFADQAQQLAKDVGIERVRPSIAPMRTDRLTIILTGQQ